MLLCVHFVQGRMHLRDAVHAFCRTGALVCYKACIFASQVHLCAVMRAFLARGMHLRDAVLAFCKTGAFACCYACILCKAGCVCMMQCMHFCKGG